jgi:hypothetical protein
MSAVLKAVHILPGTLESIVTRRGRLRRLERPAASFDRTGFDRACPQHPRSRRRIDRKSPSVAFKKKPPDGGFW